MKLRVLVDNNTYIDDYYVGEPAISYYIEDEDEKILFDTGYSNILINNAEKMGIKLNNLTKIVFSHGHNDHTGGFLHIEKHCDLKNITIIAHPNAFYKKYYDGEEIGAPFSLEYLKSKYKMELKKEPFFISERILFLGEIPEYHEFEKRTDIGEIEIEGLRELDYVLDDSAIVYRSNKGLFIITGCSHSGICNVIEHAKKLLKDDRIIGVIGGFHLFETDEKLKKTIDYLKFIGVEEMYPCHCVSFNAKAEIYKELHVHEVGVGMEIELN